MKTGREYRIESLNITETELSIIDRIHAYAKECYGYLAWDVIVECYDEADIVDILREWKLTSYTKALAHFRLIVSLKNEQRRSIMSEAY